MRIEEPSATDHAIVRERLAHLKRKTWSELAALPSCSTEEVVVDGTPADMVTYVESRQHGLRWVVVELCRRGETILAVFKTRRCYFEGFEALANGDTRPLRDDEMQKYTRSTPNPLLERTGAPTLINDRNDNGCAPAAQQPSR